MKLKLTGLYISLGLVFATPLYAVTAEEAPIKVSTQMVHSQIIKSQNDKRDYAFTTLPNGLKLLVVSDKNAQRAAVAVDVAVGSGNEPETYPGLAHFLEHMLFLGTDKYPQPDEFMQYISQHGGTNNAFTAFDHTNFFFDIDPQYLEQGMARFSRFFVAPLMTSEYVDRERHAVNAEYQSKMRVAGWRNLDVFKQALNPANPFSRFSVGSLATLPTATVRPALLKFYKDYYSADRMSVVIIGKEDTATLMKWGKAMFSEVPRGQNLASTKITAPLFKKDQLPVFIQNQSLDQDKTLSVSFMLPYHLKEIYSKVFTYIAYNLDYKGADSLAGTLKKMGYITQMSSDFSEKIGNELPFGIQMVLTDKGFAHRDEVLAVVFDYLHLLQQQSAKAGEENYQELAMIAKRDFQFQEKTGAMDEASDLAARMNNYPIKDILALDSTYSGYDRQAIMQNLALMTPQNAVVQLSAPQLHFKQQTHYFHVPYSITPLDTKAILAAKIPDHAALKAMQLPGKNTFIATNYDLQKSAINAKQETLSDGIHLFYQFNGKFDVPRSTVAISLEPQGNLSLQERVAMALWSSFKNEELIHTFYEASLAGLQGNFDADGQSLQLSISGYSQKIPLLLQTMLQNFKNFDENPGVFKRIKQTYVQTLESFPTLMPFRQTLAYLNHSLLPTSDLPQETLQVLRNMNEKTMQELVKKALSKLNVRMMVYGDTTLEQAKLLAKEVSSSFKDSQLKNKWISPKVNIINKNEVVHFDVPHHDSAVTYYLQGKAGYQAKAEVALLAQMIRTPFFNQLRTQQQLGYIVAAYNKPYYDYAGLGFSVESPQSTNAQLVEAIQHFKQNFAKGLANLTESDFTHYKTIVKNELLQKPENSAAAANRYWNDILMTNKTASQRQAMVDAIDKLSLKPFTQNMQQFLLQKDRLIIEANPLLKKN
ncbi:insulinase family protein [Actinobacillus delphinicola]|uniref:Protease 3 n=1 Tax=Actinobacillus delphinicola TaxID=51161 RepID=A0A448TSC0_9PAST|nr:insulinase family protein [Actinobacillus delphinicola]VEJ08927.1 protease III [Actinobacillus delphinicola]